MMKRLFPAILFVALTSISSPALADLIDLNDFWADPPVTVSADGRAADFVEDFSLVSVLLSNDPFLGDPEVILAEIGGVGQVLSFDYDFLEPAGNADEFGAYVIDTSTGLSAGAAFEFFADSTASGSVSFDLSSLAGKELGLQFALNAYDMATDSTLTISNVELNPVPVPGAILLAGLGLGTSAGILRKRRRLQK